MREECSKCYVWLEHCGDCGSRDVSESAQTVGYAFGLGDFVSGMVRVDFRDYTMKELKHLRKICELINPGRDVPAYSFGACYYCENGRWFEGGSHQLKGKLCRATEVAA